MFSDFWPGYGFTEYLQLGRAGFAFADLAAHADGCGYFRVFEIEAFGVRQPLGMMDVAAQADRECLAWKHSIANPLTVEFNDGSTLPEVAVEYPIGHKRHRKDGIPLPKPSSASTSHGAF